MEIEKSASSTCYIVIPAYNEGKVIGSVIQELQNKGYKHIIVIDDGSTDNTYQAVSHKNVIVLRHMLNRGKGAAVKTGIEAAKILMADKVITFDADGQHDPESIVTIQNKLKDHDVVLGMRDFSQKHIPFFKKIGNHLGNIITGFVYGLWVKDSQSGMRGYSKRALSLIVTMADRYEYDSEIMREIVRNKLSYCETEIKVRYTKYSQEKQNRQSYVGALKTVIRMMLTD